MMATHVTNRNLSEWVGHQLFMDNFVSSPDIWWPAHKRYQLLWGLSDRNVKECQRALTRRHYTWHRITCT